MIRKIEGVKIKTNILIYVNNFLCNSNIVIKFIGVFRHEKSVSDVNYYGLSRGLHLPDLNYT